jgi:alanine-glyoxylate transaminase/(R)-3-amino-2-methylpropionate-pyruvate transaminase
MNTPTLPPYNHTPRRYTGPSADVILAKRKQYLNPGIFYFYQKPIMIVEGSMQYLYDETGRRYLDAIGGIVTVSIGHCHPKMVAAAHQQNETLQHTTTIYLHPNIVEYAEALASKMPGNLKVCYFVNSGSEANDLAILMARLYTGNHDIIALRNCYHGGNSSGMSLTSHYTWKYNVPPALSVQHAAAPYPYRGPWDASDPDAGKKYAAEVKQLIEYGTPNRLAAFIAESIQGVGGAVVFPDGYLKEAYAYARAAGAVCIADEVQAGFGRTGTHYWGFETQGVIPDIVTMAKGIGNGCPLGAVVTTPEIAQTLAQKIHFNTFGGNPVCMAQAKAVLDVIDEEKLQDNCHQVGNYLMSRLNALAQKHNIIGEVRGKGLMIGVELVKDRQSKEPAKAECAQIFETAKDLGLLVGKGGLYGNTLRIKPPMCIHKADADFIVDCLDLAISKL